MGRLMITAGQIKMIHALASRLAIDEDAYRAALKIRFGMTTSKALTMDQAIELIGEWSYEASSQGLWVSNAVCDRYKDLFEKRKAGTAWRSLYHGCRNPDMASHKQLHKIHTLWSQIAQMHDDEKSDKALNKFITKIAKVSNVRFLDMDGARGVITALTKMKKHYSYDGEESRTAV